MRKWRNADKMPRGFVALYHQYQATDSLHPDIVSSQV